MAVTKKAIIVTYVCNETEVTIDESEVTFNFDDYDFSLSILANLSEVYQEYLKDKATQK